MSTSFDLINHDLNLEGNTGISDAEWLELIGDRVQWFLDNDKDLLLSYLYRLDIDESKINEALTPLSNEPAHQLLARIILDRQKQRLSTKNQYKVQQIEGWEF